MRAPTDILEKMHVGVAGVEIEGAARPEEILQE